MIIHDCAPGLGVGSLRVRVLLHGLCQRCLGNLRTTLAGSTTISAHATPSPSARGTAVLQRVYNHDRVAHHGRPIGGPARLFCFIAVLTTTLLLAASVIAV